MLRPFLSIALFVCSVSSLLAQPRSVLVTTDFTTGGLSAVSAGGTGSDDLLLIHSDARVRTFGSRVYVLNRLGQDNIIVLDTSDLSTPLTQFSTGDGSNPHEIIVVNDEKAYVSVYERDYVLVVNPSTGDSLATIDLSSFSDDDGLPEASQLALFDGHLYVACQRLDRDAFFAPTEFSTVAVIDISTDTLVDVDPTTAEPDGIRLTGTQPFGVDQRGGNWVFAEVGSFGVTDGGIEVVDLISREVSGILIPEETLQGDVNQLTMISDSEGYFVLSDANFANSIHRFDLTTGQTSGPLTGVSNGFIPALSAVSGRLYVLDRSTFDDPAGAGLKIFDIASESLLDGPIATALLPFDIAFIDVVRGDFDGSGSVDFTDFLVFASAFEKSHGQEGFSSDSDFDSNGIVDFADFLIFASSFGQ